MTRTPNASALVDPYLRRNGISRAVVAQAAGVTTACVCQWLTVRVGIHAEHARVLHAELGIPLWVMRPDLWDAPTLTAPTTGTPSNSGRAALSRPVFFGV